MNHSAIITDLKAKIQHCTDKIGQCEEQWEKDRYQEARDNFRLQLAEVENLQFQMDNFNELTRISNCNV